LCLPPQKEEITGEGNEAQMPPEATEIKGKYRVILQCSFSSEVEEQS